MPASLFGDLDHHGGGGLSMQMHNHLPNSTMNNCNGGGGGSSSSGGGSCGGSSGGSLIDEDQRVLQMALELSMLGLVSGDNNSSAALQLAASVADHHHQQQQQQQQQHHHQNNLHSQQQHHQQMCHNSMGGVMSGGGLTSDIYSSVSDVLPKKSQNMTECVPVPSSEHVAEIVGRQGCKIKALRAKTNTYIKTPVRGEEPVFVVTGRKEDVAAAKREILSAAEHFSQIRASRKGGSGNGPSAPAPVPGQVTIQVRVPYRVVGLVVGPKGATIKRIQQQTHTYIVTPSRDKDPVFEVTGLPDNVQVAKREIEAHIAIRTGSFPTDAMNPMLGENEMGNPTDILNNFYKNGNIGGITLESLGLGLGAINSLSSSLSSVSGLGLGALTQNNGVGNNAGSVGSSTSGGGSLSSLSSLNGFSGKVQQNGGGNNGVIGGCVNNGNGQLHHHHIQQSNNGTNNENGFFHGHPALADLGYSLMDNISNITQQGGVMSSSRSEDSYLFGGSGPNSIEEGSHSKLTDLYPNNQSNGSSVWNSFDRDEGLGDSPTLEANAPGSTLIAMQ